MKGGNEKGERGKGRSAGTVFHCGGFPFSVRSMEEGGRKKALRKKLHRLKVWTQLDYSVAGKRKKERGKQNQCYPQLYEQWLSNC